jgi:hypothetical protein
VAQTEPKVLSQSGDAGIEATLSIRSSVSIPWFWSGSDMRARSAGGWPQRASNGVEAGTSKTECYAGIWSNPVRERRDVSVQYLGDAIIVTTKRVLWRQRF